MNLAARYTLGEERGGTNRSDLYAAACIGLKGINLSERADAKGLKDVGQPTPSAPYTHTRIG